MRSLLKAMVVGAALLTGTFAFAQEAAPDPFASVRMPYFDEPVSFKDFHRLAVYRSWGDTSVFFILPNSVDRSPISGMSLLYENDGGSLRGNLILTLKPSFDENEFTTIIKALEGEFPGGRFSVAEPVNSEWEIQGFGLKELVTPVMMSSPLLGGTSISVEIPPLLIRTLLHDGSQYASAFVIRHKFSVRGVELDSNLQPRIVTRWFSRGVSFPGGCGLAPENYTDVISGQKGCIFRVHNSDQDIRDAQLLLATLNFYGAPVDGIAGPKTRAAIRSFQRVVSMQEDGQITSLLLTKLRDEVAKVQLAGQAQSESP